MYSIGLRLLKSGRSWHRGSSNTATQSSSIPVILALHQCLTGLTLEHSLLVFEETIDAVPEDLQLELCIASYPCSSLLGQFGLAGSTAVDPVPGARAG